MRIASRHLDELSSEDSLLLHRCATRFEAAWQHGERPAIEDYLRGDRPPRWARLVELAHTDLEHRLRTGEAARVEDYLRSYPELAGDGQVLLDLLTTEFSLRRRLPPPSLEELVRRFPALEKELAAALADDMPTLVSMCRTAADAADRTKQRLGKYLLLEVVGNGSFGTVYKACDSELGRTVALKLPRAGLAASPECLGRFLREARSAAALSHPGIVAVYDAGQAEGVWYLAAEFVAGQTLAQRLTAGRPSWRCAAEWIAALADALQHAHHNGIIHRDVKPSNILLDAADRPRLTDFGLARAGAAGGTLTHEGQVLGTPAYMAPEQANGEIGRVDGRSDVYSLGVVLYELLTGAPPFRGNPRMVLRQVLEEEPRPPRRLNDDIPRDLETVCLKAMAKEPAGRYATAAELSADLRRFLRGEPVTTRPLGVLGRGRRWCRRKPLEAALLASLFWTVCLGFASVTWQWRQAEKHLAEAGRQRDRAERNARQAHQAINDFVALGPSLSRAPDDPISVKKQLWQTAVTYYRGFLERHDQDPSFDEETWRADMASAQLNLAYSLQATGSPAEAAALYESARTQWERLIEVHPQTPSYQIGLARSYNGLAYQHGQQRRSEEAISFYRRSIRLLTSLDRQGELSEKGLDCLMMNYLRMGDLLGNLRNPPQALDAYERAGLCGEAYLKAHPDSPGITGRLAGIYGRLTRLRQQQGERNRSLHDCRRGIAWQRRLMELTPNVPKNHYSLARYYQTLGGLHRAIEQYDEALSAYEQSNRLLAEVLRHDAAHALARRLQVRNDYYLCNVLCALGQGEAALDSCRQAYLRSGQWVREHPSDGGEQKWLADICFWLGKLQGDAGQQAEAIVAFREAAQVFDQLAHKAPAEPNWRFMQGICLHSIGNRLVDMSRFAEAADHYRQAASLCETACRELPDSLSWQSAVAGTWNHLGEMEERLGHLEEALTAYRRAIARLRPVVQRSGAKSKEMDRLREFQEDETRLLRRLDRKMPVG